jgi:hypothetical protein
MKMDWSKEWFNMKNKFWLMIGIFLLCFSCNKKITLSQKGEFKKIEKMLNPEKAQVKGRRVAESSAGVCFSDQLTEERILEEIRRLEKNNVIGSKMIIGGMDLSKFPASQANYLERKREWINTQDLDLKNCTDVKCVFNKMYPLSNGVEGYLYYYFYLKMGYALSSVNVIPDVDLSGTTYQDVLFSQDELVSFYFLSKILPSSFQRLPTLARIHRMPRNTHLPSYPKACGLAGGPFNKGFIIMLDDCLKRHPGTASGPFFPTFTHELSHHLDNVLVNNIYGFSETPAWLNFSGWVRKENFNTSTNKITLEWVLKNSSAETQADDGFTSEYAKTNPGEDFADSIGYFRFNANIMQKNSPKKFEWISKNVFNGRTFTDEGLSLTYEERLRASIINGLPQVIDSCVNNKKNYTLSLESKVLREYKDFDPEMVECIFGGIEQSFSHEIANLRSEELEACDFLGSNESVLKNKVMQGIDEFIKKDLKKNSKIEKQLQILAEFISTLNEELDPREVLVTCLGSKSPSECFAQKLEKDIDDIASGFDQDIPHQVKIVKEGYQKENNYSVVQARVVGLFNQIFSSSEVKFKEEAKRRWNLCYIKAPEVEVSIEEDILLYPYNGGVQYIKSSLLNCLNRSALEDLHAILDKVGLKLSVAISSKETKNFILNLYMNNFTSTLQKLIEIAAQEEEKKVQELQVGIKQKVESDLLENTEWIENALFEDVVMTACSSKAEQTIKNELNSNFLNAVSLIKFHTFNEASWQNQICENVLKSSQVRSALVRNQVKKIDEALPHLKDLLLTNTQEDAERCRKKFTSKMMRKMRNLCLTNTIKWNEIVERTLLQWMNSEQLENIPEAKQTGLISLKKDKVALQEEALKKMNQIP